jgi:hypothetical protein
MTGRRMTPLKDFIALTTSTKLIAVAAHGVLASLRGIGYEFVVSGCDARPAFYLATSDFPLEWLSAKWAKKDGRSNATAVTNSTPVHFTGICD